MWGAPHPSFRNCMRNNSNYPAPRRGQVWKRIKNEKEKGTRKKKLSTFVTPAKAGVGSKQCEQSEPNNKAKCWPYSCLRRNDKKGAGIIRWVKPQDDRVE